MWRHYFSIGIRALARNRIYTFINIFGLSVSLAACLTIILFIRYETSFDQWLPEAERTYQLQREAVGGENDGDRNARTPHVAASQLPAQIPGIEIATSLRQGTTQYRLDGRPIAIERAYEADASFFRVLNLPLLHGDPATALSRVGDTVITESIAMRLFGRTDVIGRIVTRILPSGDRDGRITGVLRDLPSNTNLRIETLHRVDPGSPDSIANASAATGWYQSPGWVYARLRPGTDVVSVNAAIPQVLRRLVPHSPQANGPNFNLDFVNIGSVNTSSIDGGAMRTPTPMSVIVTFAIVATFLLLVACVNFTNLATARASQRAREVGLRKVLGATRSQLIVQFLSESIALVALSALIGVSLLELSLPALSAFLDAELSVHYLGQDGIAVPLALLILVVGAAGGLYPAFYLSRFRPAAVLNANRGAANRDNAGRLRSALMVGQFAVAIALIICTSVIYSQTAYARSNDPGYQTSNLLIVMRASRIGDRSAVESFLRAAREIPGVTAAARTGVYPDLSDGSIGLFRRPGSTDETRLMLGLVDGETFATLGLRLRAGRLISEAREADVGPTGFLSDADLDPGIRAHGINVVIDENAVRALGFRDPAAAVGQSLDLESEESSVPYIIVGVVNNARFSSMRFEPRPMLYIATPVGHQAIALRFNGSNAADIRSSVQRLWESRVTNAVFESSFGEERVAAMYDSDEKRGLLFGFFAALAVLISCLGLFGLAAFLVERRTLEIGIRKVLGARTRDIVRLLIWQFSQPVLISNIVAWPVAWWVMRDWLNGFADRIDLSPEPFVIAGALALAIAAATVTGHAFRVARANPILALRYE